VRNSIRISTIKSQNKIRETLKEANMNATVTEDKKTEKNNFFKTIVLNNENIDRFNIIAKRALKGVYLTDLSKSKNMNRTSKIKTLIEIPKEKFKFISPKGNKVTNIFNNTLTGLKFLQTTRSRNQDDILSAKTNNNNILSYNNTENTNNTNKLNFNRTDFNILLTNNNTIDLAPTNNNDQIREVGAQQINSKKLRIPKIKLYNDLAYTRMKKCIFILILVININRKSNATVNPNNNLKFLLLNNNNTSKGPDFTTIVKESHRSKEKQPMTLGRIYSTVAPQSKTLEFDLSSGNGNFIV
jgi:hypothetical protein